MADGNVTLLTPEISDDDRLWIARCDFDGLRSFIDHPISWVANLAKDSGGQPLYELTNNFVVEFRPKLQTPQPCHDIIIEGISKTPLVTVRIPVGAPSPTPNLAIWDAWGDEDVSIIGVQSEGLLYGHLKIVNADDPQPVRTAKLFEALAVLSCDLSLMNRLLDRRPRSVTWVTPRPGLEADSARISAGPTTPVTFAPLEGIEAGITIVYQGESESPLEACSMFVASQPNPAQWVLVETLGVKSYYPIG